MFCFFFFLREEGVRWVKKDTSGDLIRNVVQVDLSVTLCASSKRTHVRDVGFVCFMILYNPPHVDYAIDGRSRKHCWESVCSIVARTNPWSWVHTFNGYDRSVLFVSFASSPFRLGFTSSPTPSPHLLSFIPFYFKCWCNFFFPRNQSSPKSGRSHVGKVCVSGYAPLSLLLAVRSRTGGRVPFAEEDGAILRFCWGSGNFNLVLHDEYVVPKRDPEPFVGGYPFGKVGFPCLRVDGENNRRVLLVTHCVRVHSGATLRLHFEATSVLEDDVPSQEVPFEVSGALFPGEELGGRSLLLWYRARPLFAARAFSHPGNRG